MITIAKSKYEDYVRPRLKEVEAWKRDGLTDEQISKNLRISIQTFYTYKEKYLEFFESLKKGEEISILEVENALYKRALGYKYTETIKEGKLVNGKLEPNAKVKVVEKHIPADVGAMIFILKNRRPNKWRDKQEVEMNHANETATGFLGRLETIFGSGKNGK